MPEVWNMAGMIFRWIVYKTIYMATTKAKKSKKKFLMKGKRIHMLEGFFHDGVKDIYWARKNIW